MRGDTTLRALLNEATQNVTDQQFAEYRRVIETYDGCTVSEIAEESYDSHLFNCFAYALNIERHPDFQSLSAGASAIAGSALIGDLRDSGDLTPCASQELTPGRVVLYYSDGRLTHAARIGANGVLTSKWGTMAVFRHKLWEVPARFGNTFEVVCVPDPEVSVTALYRRVGVLRE